MASDADPRRTREVFTEIFRANAWQGAESRSGPGSSAARTRPIREKLVELLAELKVGVLLDAGCGDFNWMKEVPLPVERYIGVDAVEEIIEQNRRAHGRPGREFLAADLACDPLPAADFVLCRDCLVHHPNAAAPIIFENLRRTGAAWLLATTFIGQRANEDVAVGGWRPTNLERPPFSLPAPVRLVPEAAALEKGPYWDRMLGLWRFADIPRR